MTSESPSRRSDAPTCPVCEDGLVDGQGLFTCPSCGWVGTLANDGRGLRWTSTGRAYR